MENNYWNDIYWKRHLDKYGEKNLDFLSDLWVDKYPYIFNNIQIGNALDLGCGLGQYTKYLMDKGFNVISTDISYEVLLKLKEFIPDANVVQLDMGLGLPFENESFDLVLANLSIHYFDKETTKKLLNEIIRILKNGGYFIGSVNSSKTFEFIKDVATKLEDNFYYENGRTVRLWTKEQFDEFFKDFKLEELHEIETTRWNRKKVIWEFIARKN